MLGLVFAIWQPFVETLALRTRVLLTIPFGLVFLASLAVAMPWRWMAAVAIRVHLLLGHLITQRLRKKAMEATLKTTGYEARLPQLPIHEEYSRRRIVPVASFQFAPSASYNPAEL